LLIIPLGAALNAPLYCPLLVFPICDHHCIFKSESQLLGVALRRHIARGVLLVSRYAVERGSAADFSVLPCRVLRNESSGNFFKKPAIAQRNCPPQTARQLQAVSPLELHKHDASPPSYTRRQFIRAFKTDSHPHNHPGHRARYANLQPP
jgi:hypothetical protein